MRSLILAVSVDCCRENMCEGVCAGRLKLGGVGATSYITHRAKNALKFQEARQFRCIGPGELGGSVKSY
jgi:hypothetical protein